MSASLHFGHCEPVNTRWNSVVFDLRIKTSRSMAQADRLVRVARTCSVYFPLVPNQTGEKSLRLNEMRYGWEANRNELKHTEQPSRLPAFSVPVNPPGAD